MGPFLLQKSRWLCRWSHTRPQCRRRPCARPRAGRRDRGAPTCVSSKSRSNSRNVKFSIFCHFKVYDPVALGRFTRLCLIPGHSYPRKQPRPHEHSPLLPPPRPVPSLSVDQPVLHVSHTWTHPTGPPVSASLPERRELGVRPRGGVWAPHSCPQLRDVPLGARTTFCAFVHLSADTLGVTSFRPLHVVPL